HGRTVGGAGDHDGDDVRLGHGVGDRIDRLTAGRDEILGALRTAVVADHLVAGLHEVDGHGAAHDAETDECDGAHAGCPSRVLAISDVSDDGAPGGAVAAGHPVERIGAGGLVLEADVAGVAAVGQLGEVAVEVERARAGFAATGGVGDLYVTDEVAVFLQGGGDVVAVDLQVVKVGEQP